MSSLVQTPAPSIAAAPPKRRWRNFLLDARFQLRFTGYIVAIALLVAALLGAVLWSTARALLRQAEAAVEARSQVAETSKSLSTATLNNKLLEHLNDPTFERQLARDAQDIDARYDAERAATVTQRADLLRRQQRIWLVLVACLGAFVVLITLVSIVTTHRVAGPLFRIKQLAKDVGEGRLPPGRPMLRERDELQDVFAALSEMVENLRATHRDDLSQVRALIAQARAAGHPGTLVAELEALASRIEGRIG